MCVDIAALTYCDPGIQLGYLLLRLSHLSYRQYHDHYHQSGVAVLCDGDGGKAPALRG